jgi:magnesium chelatase family protein
MLARVTTFAIDGVDPRQVWVEVDIRSGLPAFTIVGLGDASVRESRDRIRSAVAHSGFKFPQQRITANLAPAFLRKVGPGFDAALAVAVLAASEQIPTEALASYAVFGELSLGGELRDTPGALAVAEGAWRAGLRRLIVPSARAREAALVRELTVAGVSNLREAAGVISSGKIPELPAAPPGATIQTLQPDLADVRGHAAPLLALEVAAAGSHNLLLEGAPGTGKTMLARRIPSILPALTETEAIAVTRITTRPFRAPHHTISPAGLVGGGVPPRPGEATLAHNGVLFLDELSEFQRSTLDALRQPLEDGCVTIVRSQRMVVFPTRFMLVAATNPCPCGFAGVGEADLRRHRRRLSGPLLDRLDLLINVQRPSAEELRGLPHTTSAQARERVAEARERQKARLAGTGALCNGELDARLVRRHVVLESAAEEALGHAYDRGTLSARGRHRALRVARTIADLHAHERVTLQDVLTALSLRQRDAVEQALAA